jgi:hypothetical protein
MGIRSFKVDPFDHGSEEDNYLTQCAKLRNISVHSLLKRLVRTIARDQMVGAILDDAEHLQDRKPGEKRFRGDRRGYITKQYPL